MRLQKRVFGMLIVLLLLTMTAIGQIYPEMILVEGGTFMMGSNSGDDDEKPIHRVTLKSYKIGKTEVTVAQYRAFCTSTGRSMPEEPAYGWGDDHPIVDVTFSDAVAYCDWLTVKKGGLYRLPTEAEWEYAARGGNKSRGYTYAGGKNLSDVAWYYKNAGFYSKPVGSKKANELGIYDMSGSVWEWCADWYASDYYSNSPTVNPTGPNRSSSRVLRGGSFSLLPEYCRVTNRSHSPWSFRDPDRGFRVALSL